MYNTQRENSDSVHVDSRSQMSTGTPQAKPGESARDAKGGISTEPFREPCAMARRADP